MNITNLPDSTRVELHNHVKIVIHKYYKGLRNGSLQYDAFVDKMLSSKLKPNWLKEHPSLQKDDEFKESLTNYIRNTITKYAQLEQQNKANPIRSRGALSKNTIKKDATNTTISVSERQELKKIVQLHGYSLTIPSKFLTSMEAQCLKNYIVNKTPIPLGWEKVLNYIKKLQ